MTNEELQAIRERADGARELCDELHTERINYGAYLTLRDTTDDVPALRAEIAQLRRERDAAVEDIHVAYEKGICEVCKTKQDLNPICLGKNSGKCVYEWRGLEGRG